jgi:hypothetical protein
VSPQDSCECSKSVLRVSKCESSHASPSWLCAVNAVVRQRQMDAIAAAAVTESFSPPYQCLARGACAWTCDVRQGREPERKDGDPHLNEIVNHVEPTKPAFVFDLGSKHRLWDGLSRRVVRGEARHDAEVPRVRLEEL